MAQSVTIAKHDKRKRLVLPDDFVAEAPYGEYIIREGKGHLSIVAIPAPKTKRTYEATAALERKLKEAKGLTEKTQNQSRKAKSNRRLKNLCNALQRERNPAKVQELKHRLSHEFYHGDEVR